MNDRIATVPIPDLMRALPRDDRGYPIPVLVYRDQHGKPHFTINDSDTAAIVLSRDLCPICGVKLPRGRWFVGGPLSAFLEIGHYQDPPMHHECAVYALKVCPYLAMPSYRGRIEERTLAADDQMQALVKSPVIMRRPPMFVCSMTFGYRVKPSSLLEPQRPWRRIEYWRDGVQLSQEEGEAIARNDLAQELPEQDPFEVIIRPGVRQ